MLVAALEIVHLTGSAGFDPGCESARVEMLSGAGVGGNYCCYSGRVEAGVQGQVAQPELEIGGPCRGVLWWLCEQTRFLEDEFSLLASRIIRGELVETASLGIKLLMLAWIGAMDGIAPETPLPVDLS